MITTPGAVDLLFDLRASRMLSPFLSAEHTLTSAAKALRCAPSTLAHWIPKFLRNGLIDEVRVEARNGAPMRWYRAPADPLFVPMASVPEAIRTTFLSAGRHRVLDLFTSGIDEQLRRDPATGITFRSSGSAGVEVALTPEQSGPQQAWAEFWGTISLTSEQAGELAAELDSLIRRYRALDGGPVEVVVHAGTVRVSSRRLRRRRVAPG